MVTWRGSSKENKGSVLVVALVFLLILTIAGITAMRFSNMGETMAGNSQSRNYVFQQAVSEVYLNLFDFQNNVGQRNRLVVAQESTEKEKDENLLKMLPGSHRASIQIDSKLKDTGSSDKKNRVRFIKEGCEDGSSFNKFICLSYEIDVQAKIDNGATTKQTQGFVFKNNKAE